MATDAINRYNYKFALSTLEQMVYEHCTEGVPSYYNHDVHQPIGWGIPFALFFEPNLIRILGIIYIPETDEDGQQINLYHRIAQKERYEDPCQPYLSEFKPLIEGFTNSDLKFFFEGAVNCYCPDILKLIFPDLLNEIDKDGLVKIQSILETFDYIGKGVFKHKHLPFSIFVHKYFRRSMSRHNNFHWSFLDELLSTHKDVNLVIKIKVDIDIIGFSPSLRPIEELDYWYGPLFYNDISNIKLGITHHESNETQRIKFNLIRTEFHWKQDDHEKTFESEELTNSPAPGIEGNKYGCRYTHAIYDLTSKSFKHFDGAIRSYDEEMMLERLDKKFLESGRNTVYEKLFRIDGSIQVSVWKSLLNKYYQGNPLIQEYLGIDYASKFQDKVLDDEEALINEINRLIPYPVRNGDGVKICVSYHKQRDEISESRSIVAFDELTLIDKTVPSLEYDIIELKKFLNKLGEDLGIPKDIVLAMPQDLYWNIPKIFHSGVNPFQSLEFTLKALLSIFDRLIELNSNYVVSICVSINAFEREVTISSCGPVADLASWLRTNVNIPLSNREEFNQWLLHQSHYLNSITPSESPQFNLKYIHGDGVLYLKRTPLQEEIDVSFENNEAGLSYQMTIPQSLDYLMDAVENKLIAPAFSFTVAKAICSKTNQDYATSPFSRLLAETSLVIQKGDPLGLFWTDRPY